MIRCNRQCSIPASTAARDRRAPWRKNNSAMAIALPFATQTALSCLHGKTSDSKTTPRMARVKLSGNRRESSFNRRCDNR